MYFCMHLTTMLIMKRQIKILATVMLMAMTPLCPVSINAAVTDSVEIVAGDSLADDFGVVENDSSEALVTPIESEGFHQSLKRKFIEGNAGFMSLVALALILGLAFCIERIIYLSLSEIDAKKFMQDLERKCGELSPEELMEAASDLKAEGEELRDRMEQSLEKMTESVRFSAKKRCP